MSYLIDKTDLKANRYYRKVKLDINEVMDRYEAQEDLGINVDIYGDNEGYFFVSKKQKDNYLVKFINLNYIVNNQIIDIKLSRKEEKIESFKVLDIKKLTVLPKEELDFDEMDENYVKLDFNDIVNELIQQANSKGKKGIKLDKEYLEKYSKELGESKKKK